MEVVVLSIHLLVSICLIGLVLLQRSEGGALGIGGGGGGSLMSGRGASDALAKLTSIAGGLFLVVSLALTYLSGGGATGERSVFDFLPEQQAPAATTPAPEAPAPATPDPTESSLPSENELAAILPGPAEAAAAPPAGAQRAGPIAAQPAAAQPQRTVAAATQPAATQRTAPPANTQRTANAAQPRAANQPAGAANSALELPNTSGAVSGVTFDDPGPTESVEVGNGLEAVRRERAGPDQ